jgi:hypothetical protein
MSAKMPSRTLKVLFSLVALFVGSFLKSAQQVCAPRVRVSFYVAMYGGQNMVPHKFDGDLWDPEAKIYQCGCIRVFYSFRHET